MRQVFISKFDDISICDDVLLFDIGTEVIKVSLKECVNESRRHYGRPQTKCVAERDITQNCFIFFTNPRICIVFKGRKIADRLFPERMKKEFRKLRKTIESLHYSTYDLS